MSFSFKSESWNRYFLWIFFMPYWFESSSSSISVVVQLCKIARFCNLMKIWNSELPFCIITFLVIIRKILYQLIKQRCWPGLFSAPVPLMWEPNIFFSILTQVACDMWLMTCDLWYMTCGMWHVSRVGILFQLGFPGASILFVNIVFAAVLWKHFFPSFVTFFQFLHCTEVWPL